MLVSERNSHRVATRLDEDEVSLTHIIDALGRNQETAIINESELYNVIWANMNQIRVRGGETRNKLCQHTLFGTNKESRFIMNQLQVFNYQANEIRTVIRDGEPWWVLKGVCGILGLSNATVVADRLDDDERAKFDLGRQGGDKHHQRVRTLQRNYSLRQAGSSFFSQMGYPRCNSVHTQDRKLQRFGKFQQRHNIEQSQSNCWYVAERHRPLRKQNREI
jgi:prophage antirepressor-like protein